MQYAETDLDFVSRLLEDEGISYDFDHDHESEREVMVLHDSADHWAEVPTLDDTGCLPVITTTEDLADLESIQRLTWSRALRPHRAGPAQLRLAHADHARVGRDPGRGARWPLARALPPRSEPPQSEQRG